MAKLVGDRWFYHPDGRAEVGWAAEESEWFKNGWYDTPADFPAEKDVEDVPVFADMNRTEVRLYGREHGVELAWKGKDAMLDDLIKHLEG